MSLFSSFKRTISFDSLCGTCRLLFTVSAFEMFLRGLFMQKTRVKRGLPMLEDHLEWANASYYHSSEGTVIDNSNTGCIAFVLTVLRILIQLCRLVNT